MQYLSVSPGKNKTLVQKYKNTRENYLFFGEIIRHVDHAIIYMQPIEGIN